MTLPDFQNPGPLLAWLSSLSTPLIAGLAVLHVFVFFVLWIWYVRDLRIIAACLDDFTRGLRHRSVLGRSSPLTTQIDAFVQDISDVLTDPNRRDDRVECLRRIHILDERRTYLDSLSFETIGNIARTMIEAYPLAGVLGTILAIGSALQKNGNDAVSTAATLSGIVSRFGDAIWSTFAGLCAAIFLMFVNSVLEPRFGRLTASRAHVREIVARAKRELGLAVLSREATLSREDTKPAELPSP